jgi:ATP-dependent Lon protease
MAISSTVPANENDSSNDSSNDGSAASSTMLTATGEHNRQQLILAVLAVPGVILPGSVVTIALDSEAAKTAVNIARANDGRLVLVPQLEGRTPVVGVIARVPDVGTLPNGMAAAIVQAEQRGLLGDELAGERGGAMRAVTPVKDHQATPRIDALARELRVVLTEIAELRNSRRLPDVLRTITAAGELADAVTAWSDASDDHKLTILEAVELGARVDLVLEWAKHLLAETQIDRQIRNDVAEGMEHQQREFLLRQQLNAIRKELGEGDDAAGDDYRSKLEALAAPPKVRDFVGREIDRLERTNSQSPEQGWIRTWLDRIFDLPWGTFTADNLDLTAARGVLDADHEGLSDVKDRIIEFLAVRKLKHDRAIKIALTDPPEEQLAAAIRATAAPAADGQVGRAEPDQPGSSPGGNDSSPAGRRADDHGAIVTLVGPPGVGKTSLGESVARAMGRKFVRVALGGVRDEAEIRGHRRTYVGSQPGRIVRAMTEAGSMNPVILLDEVDKLSAGGWSGDPTAALLEVLDPAQNHTFRDHYLEVELDLSQVVFLATANVLDTIPGALLDRMEVVRLDGYTEDEKVFIAERHLLPRQVTRAGLVAEELELAEAATRRIIAEYTREAGVRNLERELGKLTRKVAARVGGGTVPPVVIDAEGIPSLLGRPRFVDEVAARTNLPGVATGLAVTGAGGDVLFIEASASAGEPSLTLTGQLGDVMKESAQIALSFIRAHAEELGVDPERLNRRFHIHVPAGAVPKDGPSAGITMTTAFVSLLTGKAVKPTVGMTGEITLQGNVLPIGGLKQKVLAAHRAGLREVVLPVRNGPDLEDVPERVRDEMTFHLATTYADVLQNAFA